MSVETVYIRNYMDALKFAGAMMRGKDPTPGWEMISIDTEYYRLSYDEIKDNPESPTTELYFFQFSNGKKTVCVDGPFTSTAEGEKGMNAVEAFRQIIESPRILKIYSTMHADVNTLEEAGYHPRGFHADTEVMDWMHDENRYHHGLKECASDHCKLYMKTYDDTFGYYPLKKDGTPQKRLIAPSMREVVWGSERFPHLTFTGATGRARARPYAALDPYATWVVYETLRAKLDKEGLWDIYEKVERPFGETLRLVERRGIKIDTAALRLVQARVKAQLLRLQHVFRAMVGNPDFNLKSVQQIKALFIDKMKLPVVSETEPGSGKPSFDATALEIYSEDGVEEAGLLLENRQAATLDGTFITGLLDKLVDGVAYTRFKHTGTVTGRIASGDKRAGKPNLQNIPAKKEKDPYKLRSFFTARPGCKLIVADYAQIELYILAQWSKDKRMIQAFARGEDLHMITASENFDIALPKAPVSWDESHPDKKRWVAECETWKEKHKSQRGDAKVLNFGIPYGLTAWKLHFDLEIELEDAERRVERYFRVYAGVARWIASIKSECRDNGFVKTVAGRRRRVVDINFRSKDEKLMRRKRGHAENQTVNAPIQGTAGDVIKKAMNLIERDEVLHDLECVQLIQVHDELVIEVPDENAEKAAKRVNDLMILPYGRNDPDGDLFFTDVDIKVAVGIGPSWASAKH
jgi:DNA polymerase-1